MYAVSVGLLVYVGRPFLQSLLFGVLVSVVLQLALYVIATSTGIGYFLLKDLFAWAKAVPDMTVRQATAPFGDLLVWVLIVVGVVLLAQALS